MSRICSAVSWLWMAFAIVLAMAAFAIAEDAERLTIEGELSYRARIALRPESTAIVEVREAGAAEGRAVVAETRMELEGRQVPFRFTLAVDRHKLKPATRYTVRGAIFSDGKPLWVSEPVKIDTSASLVRVGTLNLVPVRTQAFRADLDCGGLRIVVGFDQDSMLLTVDGETIEMRRASGGDGLTFAAIDDPATTYVPKGDGGLLVLRGKAHPACERLWPEDRVFRAVGQEPGWVLEIENGDLALNWDYGEKSLVATVQRPSAIAGGTRFETVHEGKPLVIVIRDMVCADSMSGLPYPKTVTVTLGEMELNGCGGDTSALLRGKEWTVTKIDGRDPVENSRISLTFERMGRLSGSASCNRFTGSYTITGEGVSFGLTGTTFMACPEPLMRQERGFLDLLRSVSRFEIADDGALALITGDEQTIIARR